MTYYFLTRKDGQIVSFSKDGQMGFDSELFDLIEKDITEDELSNIYSSIAVYIDNDQFRFVPHEEIIDVQSFVEKMKNGTATQDDKDQMLIHLLQNIQN